MSWAILTEVRSPLSSSPVAREGGRMSTMRAVTGLNGAITKLCTTPRGPEEAGAADWRDAVRQCAEQQNRHRVSSEGDGMGTDGEHLLLEILIGSYLLLSSITL